MSSLQKLFLFANHKIIGSHALTGGLTPEWSKMLNLKHVNVRGNLKFTNEPLPTQWGDLQALTSFALGWRIYFSAAMMFNGLIRLSKWPLGSTVNPQNLLLFKLENESFENKHASELVMYNSSHALEQIKS